MAQKQSPLDLKLEASKLMMLLPALLSEIFYLFKSSYYSPTQLRATAS